jgi:hypothetical protein
LVRRLNSYTHQRLIEFLRAVYSVSVSNWQSSDLSYFYQFCDYIENAELTNKTIPGPDGVGLELALEGYARYVNAVDSPFPGHWNTYNTSASKYTGVDIMSNLNNVRSYKWWECKWPIGYDQVAPPAEYPALISRLINDEYHMRICDNFFPEENEKTRVGVKHRSYEQLNEFTGGWADRNSSRLLFTNGLLDPWIHTTGSSRFRPGGPMKDTPQVPVKIVSDGGHCSDLNATSCREKPGCKSVLDFGLDQIAKWVAEYDE